MNQFQVLANEYLSRNSNAFYHVPYVRMGIPGNPDYLNHLKNTFNDFSEQKLQSAVQELRRALQDDLPQIFRSLSRPQKNVAVIGLLTPDEDTEVAESEVVSKLVDFGATIVSGLALGCDTVAHRQALRSEGKTVAILPGPLNEILPSANKELAEEIVKKNGLLITEYYERAKSKMELSGRYQERDRLQALFSDCVILAASYAKNNFGFDSGSRLAMEYATNYSIPRAVMYDSARNSENPKYDLNRQLIREQEGIVVINRENMDSALEGVLCKQSPQPVESIGQADLFG